MLCDGESNMTWNRGNGGMRVKERQNNEHLMDDTFLRQFNNSN